MRSLEKPGQYKEYFFAGAAHGKSSVCSIAMQEKRLEKQG
jgi:hypothetical protein